MINIIVIRKGIAKSGAVRDTLYHGAQQSDPAGAGVSFDSAVVMLVLVSGAQQSDPVGVGVSFDSAVVT